MTDWKANAVVKSYTNASDRWTVEIALPLADLLPGGVKPGKTLYFNVIRSTPKKEGVVWSPTLVGYHAPTRFGELVLEE